ncbi:hypothetical protein [Abditibacterium utsteinense]|uniref:hypothetical protein n=1 Tax=Abditibacterium utsteinense TaxID=1960156 RepID=UPI0013008375|nr:hypothetical protein [Abditibacterium utsteinense]
MRRNRLLLSLFLLAAPVSKATATPKEPITKIARRTVVDYFQLLPVNAGILEDENREV